MICRSSGKQGSQAVGRWAISDLPPPPGDRLVGPGCRALATPEEASRGLAGAPQPPWCHGAALAGVTSSALPVLPLTDGPWSQDSRRPGLGARRGGLQRAGPCLEGPTGAPSSVLSLRPIPEATLCPRASRPLPVGGGEARPVAHHALWGGSRALGGGGRSRQHQDVVVQPPPRPQNSGPVCRPGAGWGGARWVMSCSRNPSWEAADYGVDTGVASLQTLGQCLRGCAFPLGPVSCASRPNPLPAREGVGQGGGRPRALGLHSPSMCGPKALSPAPLTPPAPAPSSAAPWQWIRAP